ncbi:MAG TPA: division/cell wall cluster transcriptional repressor MraZ [Candidatus Fournierella merdavium]|mgnify:CR=1 FL=1|uniref:division/cell wall cluster transcriptional repressor MraZ n=1 Tax=Candidatus Allofournierella merdavium TaxID=2838593 RepID=UPI001F9CA453|nr:division/cell wall cluster transcriptional repressor MraZ [Candidatus Fournierella merdavium]
MLMGEYNYTIDDKGRLNFPAKFREKMGAAFVVTRWLDDCLVAFPEEEWQRITDILRSKSMVKTRDIQRFLYAAAQEVTPDKQGRILLEPALRAHAGLQKEVTVIGVGGYAEIWDTAAWQKKQQSLSGADIEAAMEELDF